MNQVNILDYHIYKTLECGGKSASEKHTARDKLMVRDRIDRLVDVGYNILFYILEPLS
jgi:acetyl-CoA carboxylase carboxyltransferase component